MPWRNALREPEVVSGDAPTIHPIRQTLPACCARAASGHVAAPPTNEMKVRRLIYPSSRGPNVPHRQEADTALCGTAKLIADCPLGVLVVRKRAGGRTSTKRLQPRGCGWSAEQNQ